MYCWHCGKEISDDAYFCSYCGSNTRLQQQPNAYMQQPTAPMQQPTVYMQQPTAPVQQSASNTLAIVGFILSFFIPIAGLICSIIGFMNSAGLGGKGKGLSIAGICVSAAWVVFALIYYFSFLHYILYI